MNSKRRSVKRGVMKNEIEDLDPVGEFASRASLTRYQLVIATIKLVGDRGYEATTTRDISKEAQVNLAAIGYHFGSKDNLRRVVAHSVAAYMSSSGPGSIADKVSVEKIDLMSADEARQMFKKMATLAATPNASGSLDESLSRYFFQEFHSNSEAAEILYDNVFKRDLDLVARIVSKIRGIEPASEEAQVAALMLIAQVSFIWGPLSVPVKRLGWGKISQREADMIVDNIWIA